MKTKLGIALIVIVLVTAFTLGNSKPKAQQISAAKSVHEPMGGLSAEDK